MKFAIMLQSHSAEAYALVRSTFKNYLPHPKSISRWSKIAEDNPSVSSE